MASNVDKKRLEELKVRKEAADAAVVRAQEAVEIARKKVRAAEKKAETCGRDYAAAAYEYMVVTGAAPDPLAGAEPSAFTPSGFEEEE